MRLKRGTHATPAFSTHVMNAGFKQSCTQHHVRKTEICETLLHHFCNILMPMEVWNSGSGFIFLERLHSALNGKCVLLGTARISRAPAQIKTPQPTGK